mgnify:CR=1 FL=1
MSLLAVLCVRDQSSRRPEKWAADVGGLPVLAHIVARLRLSRSVDKIVVATPEHNHGRIPDWCVANGVPVVYGPEDDLVSRFGEAVYHHAKEGDFVFRAMTDQPFLDWRALDFSTSVMRAHSWDFVLPLTFDRDPVYGAGLSPWSWRAWKWIESRSTGEEREHVGMRLRRDLREFLYGLVDLPHWAFRPYRLEVDTDQDLLLMNAIWARWRASEKIGQPTLQWVVTLLDRNRDISMLNSMVEEKTGTFTTFTVAEQSAWERDYVSRPIVFTDLPSAIGYVETRSATCRTCGGPLVTVRLGSKRVKFRCVTCGGEQTYQV